ncbi:hypothetical protein PVMG_02388 [Plasmodium vivax Mauritania I]|uniref:Uncharacterized protein n=1 Tax=Plasmodium vivax Mauritania I TaxID=1035515 RepID=A0A0J9THA7_PLAVI|nr:hypothetical protein PVMG_02388 [Plasmodium vivax Mauritania I]
MLESRAVCARQTFDLLASRFSCSLKLKGRGVACRKFSGRKTVVYEHIVDEDFLTRKGNSINSIVNHSYINERMREINSLLKGCQAGCGKQNGFSKEGSDKEHVDQVIKNLYVLCVNGNIDTSDDRMRYYVNFVLRYVYDHLEDAPVIGGEKQRRGKKFVSINSYMLLLDVLKALNMRDDYGKLLKYVSENIHFFSVDVVKRIAFNYDMSERHHSGGSDHTDGSDPSHGSDPLRRNVLSFFKEVIRYMYGLIQSDSELYYREIDNMNACINICTHFFFGKKYCPQKKTYHYGEDEDVVYLYSMNYIYIKHIATLGELVRARGGSSEDDSSSKKSPNEGLLTPSPLGDFYAAKYKWEEGTSGHYGSHVGDAPDKLRIHTEDMLGSCADKESGENSLTPDIARRNAQLTEDFLFNFHAVDTIYLLYNFYTHLLLKKKKQTRKEHVFLFFPDVRENITDILLSFIRSLRRETSQNKGITNKKIIASLERALILGTAFEVPFALRPFLLYHCNVLLLNKFDLSVLDNIKLLALLRQLWQGSAAGEEAGGRNMPIEGEEAGGRNLPLAGLYTDGRKLPLQPGGDNSFDQLAKMDNPAVQVEKKKKKKKIPPDQLHTQRDEINAEDSAECQASSHLFVENLIKLIFNNLKKCLHNAKGNDLCMLMPAVYTYHKYMDEELKNILTVQVICNKESMNAANMVNILRVFCKMGYKNELIDKFVYNNMKFLTHGKDNSPVAEGGDTQNVTFSCPKLFLLFFYYKGKNGLFTYKDIYYVENYIQNCFFEMNIKDFIFLLLIYFKNGIFFLPPLLLKICVIFNNGKKYIQEDDLLFGLFLLAKNYHALASSADESGAQDGFTGQQPPSVIDKINLFRKSQYSQLHIDNFVNTMNDVLLYLYDDKLINCKADEVRQLQGGETKADDLHTGEKQTDQQISNMALRNDHSFLHIPSETKNNWKKIFNNLQYNMRMMKIFYLLYYPLLNASKKKKKKILNIHHEKFITYLFSLFNDNFSKHEKDVKYIPPLLHYFSYFDVYSPVYFKMQMSYIMQNCAFDCSLLKYTLLSHVLVRREMTREIKNRLKEYVAKNWESFQPPLQVLSLKHCNYFLDLNGDTEKADQGEDHLLFNKMVNGALSNLPQMKAKHYLDMYITICNNAVRVKRPYIELFNHMNRQATHYSGEQLMLILFYMYRTGYSKPKIRKKIRNLILHYHKKRKIDLGTYIKYVLPLDEFGIFHLFPVKFQRWLYDQLTEDVRACVRKPLTGEAECSVESKKGKETGEQQHAPIYLFEQMVKSY